MFQNAYQGGSYLEIYDAKVNKDKDKNYAHLYRMTTPQGFSKIYDKDIKGYIYTIDGHSTKMRFPKDDKIDLCIVQHFLVLQIYLPFGSPWNLEIGIADTSKVNRRINLVSALNKIETKYFHVKVPNDIVKRGVWMNLSIDVHSFMEAWKGQTFRSIDNLTIGSNCKLRRVYSMKYPIFEYSSDEGPEFIPEQVYLQSSSMTPYKQEDTPKNFAFPPGFPYINQLINYQRIMENVDPKYLESADNAEVSKTAVGATHQKTFGKGTVASTKGLASKSVKTGVNSLLVNNSRKQQIQQFDPQMEITQDFQEKSQIGIKAKDISSPIRSPVPRQGQKQQQQQQQIFKKENQGYGSNNFYDDEEQKQDHRNKDIRSQSKEVRQNQQKNQKSAVSSSQQRESQMKSKKGEEQMQQSKTPNSTKKGTNLSPNNPWHGSKSPKNLFQEEDEEFENEREQEYQQQQVEEEIEENLEAEYYDNYEIDEDLQSLSKGKESRSQGKSNNGSQENQKRLQQGQSKVEEKSKVVLEQKRNVKSANNFGQNKPSSLGIQKVKKEVKKNENEEENGGRDQNNDNKTISNSDLDEQSYFQLTQKFNTISDPNQFRDLADRNKDSSAAKIDGNTKEIEEDIEVDNQFSSPNGKKTQGGLKNNQKENNENQKQLKQSQKSQQKQQQQPQQHKQQRNMKDNFEDSLEIPYQEDEEDEQQQQNYYKGSQNIQTSPQKENGKKNAANKMNKNSNIKSNRSVSTNETNIKQNSNSNKYNNYNIYENHLNKFINDSSRPFTPPFNNVVPIQSSSIVTKKNGQTVVLKNTQEEQSEQENYEQLNTIGNNKEAEPTESNLSVTGQPLNGNTGTSDQEQLEVIYDPVLNCYYDPNSKQYYELTN